MRALYKDIRKPLQTVEISNELHILQQYVGGHIEVVDLAPSVAVIFNEEGRLKGLEANFYLDAVEDVIVGPAIFVGTDGDEFCDIGKEDEIIIRNCFDEEVIVND